MIKNIFDQIMLIGAGYVDYMTQRAQLEYAIAVQRDLTGTLLGLIALGLGAAVIAVAYTLIKRGMELDFERDYKIRRAEEKTEEWRDRAEEKTEEWRDRAEKAWAENKTLKGKE